MTNVIAAPVKGIVWRHAQRRDWQGEPLELTVVSVVDGIVHSRDRQHTRIQTPVDSWPRMCAEVVTYPPLDRGPRLSNNECATLFDVAHKAGKDAAANAFASGAQAHVSVNVRPGSSAFACYLRTCQGGHKSNVGGVELWITEFSPSFDRQMAYAQAFADILIEAGIKASTGYRMW